MNTQEKKLPIFAESRDGTSYGILMPDGKIIDLYPSIKIGFNFQTKFNPNTYEFPYDGEDAICLNDIQDDIKEVACYEHFDLDYDYGFRLTPSILKEIIQKFKEQGFNVTKEAVEHQYGAWKDDYKSGYRDDKNGYHLFTPCGCNPFSIRVTTLHPLCADWQATYKY